MSALLEVKELSKRFPIRLGLRERSYVSAVEDVTFEVASGESFGIVGESGSGKSTLARMIVRLIRPTSGEIVFDQRPFASLDRRAGRELRKRIQIVFQDPQSSLDPRMKVGDVVAEGLYHAALTRRARAVRVAELLDDVGLDAGVARNYPHQLSGGQRQRVGIARALAADPDLLIADEPVSALDASVQGQILNLLRTLQQERRLSLIFVAHELPVARYMSDRVAVMHLGKVVEIADADAVFDRPAHPYTQALLAAMPTYGQERHRRLLLHGELPSAVAPPPVCRFASRCVRRIERCTAEEPELTAVGDESHLAACFNPAPSLESARWISSRSSS